MIYRKIALLLAFLSTSCTNLTPEKFTADKPLYEHASKLFDQKSYPEAVTFLESLRNRFPQSPYMTEAELKIAEAKFRQGEYAEAEVEFRNFRTLHPTHAKIPHVVLQLGMTHFKRIPRGIDRDQTQTERAIGVFEELLRRWPASAEASEAQPLLVKCRRNLLEREMYVADFYLRDKQYSAALLRLQTVRSNTEFKDLAAEAGYKLGYAQTKLRNKEAAKEVLRALLNDPEAKVYHEKAKALLAEIDSP